jgi:polar amino acid transport system substrate-binding protein
MGTTMVEAVQRRFDELIDALLDGSLDIIAAGMSITPDRCGRVLFSAPDFVASTALLVREGNPLGLTDFVDIARARVPVAVLDGSVEQGFARAAGVPTRLIHAVSTQLDLYQEVFGGQVPVGALTDISLRSIVARERASGLQIVRVGGSGLGGRPGRIAGGFGFRPGDRSVRDEFSAGLKALHRSGRWLTIVRPFGLTTANRPPAELTTAELCAPR